jgi:hypothetical protein
VRTPRHLQNIGYTRTSPPESFVNPLGGNFWQELDLDFINLNNADGYNKVNSPQPLMGTSPSYAGIGRIQLSFPRAGVEGSFAGQYNGAGRRIIRFENTVAGLGNVGIFENISGNGYVHNLTVTNTVLRGANNIGTVAGTNDGTIRNVNIINSRLTGSGNFIGGVAGTNSGTVRDSYIELNTLDGTSNNVGGIVGSNTGTGIVQNVNTLNNRLSGAGNIGGAAGINDGIITLVHTICTTPTSFTYTGTATNVGGIAGRNNNMIAMCAVENQSMRGLANVGGVAGHNTGRIEDVYYIDTRNAAAITSPLTGMIAVTDPSSPHTAGGIVGLNQVTVTGQNNGSSGVTRALYLGIAPRRTVFCRCNYYVSDRRHRQGSRGRHHGQSHLLLYYRKTAFVKQRRYFYRE